MVRVSVVNPLLHGVLSPDSLKMYYKGQYPTPEADRGTVGRYTLLYLSQQTNVLSVTSVPSTQICEKPASLFVTPGGQFVAYDPLQIVVT